MLQQFQSLEVGQQIGLALAIAVLCWFFGMVIWHKMKETVDMLTIYPVGLDTHALFKQAGVMRPLPEFQKRDAGTAYQPERDAADLARGTSANVLIDLQK